MSLANYEPVNFINRMQSDLNDFYKLNGKRLVPSIFDHSTTLLSSEWMPSVDIKENRKQFVVTVDVPGVNSNDIEVSMENACLSIKGERKVEKEETDENHRRRECSYGAFERRFSMPDTADAERVTAKQKDGVLTITVAKKKAAKPRSIEIES